VDGLAIYREAKTIDGLTGDGTTLDAALTAAQRLGFLPDDAKRFSVPKGDRQAAKYAVHRFGGFCAAFDCRDDWTESARVWVGENGAHLGGHAVWACGYETDGLWMQNSWGLSVGWNGLQKITWANFDRDFLYGIAVYGGWR
jgi:hypothetical protein